MGDKLTILESDKDLPDVAFTKGLNRREISADGWTELPAHKIFLPFNNSIQIFGVSSVDADSSLIINGCVYILLELRGIYWSFEWQRGCGLTQLAHHQASWVWTR